jgi:Fe-S-cluster containining protein
MKPLENLNKDTQYNEFYMNLNYKINEGFRYFIQGVDGKMVDECVEKLLPAVENEINCTQCGACCKELMINVTKDEVFSVTKALSIEKNEFLEKHIEQSASGDILIMNTIPCFFLSGSKCGIYENRFNECREFPHLHKPNLAGRMFGTLMHYGRCAIIFNVVEQLKEELNFITE